ncbi:MAG TPA: AAA family ATPase, partial [Chryseosolibacter sp.]
MGENEDVAASLDEDLLRASIELELRQAVTKRREAIYKGGTNRTLNQILFEQALQREQQQEQQVRNIREEISNRMNVSEEAFAETRPREPHPCQADWNDTRDDPEHYKDLLTVQRHKCTPNYCQRQRRNANGDPIGETFCRFGFPKPLRAKSRIEFEEYDNGSVRVKFVSTRNDQRMNQHNKMLLCTWKANCDMQLVLDEEMAIKYMVKYASKPEQRSSQATSLIGQVVNTNWGMSTNNNGTQEPSLEGNTQSQSENSLRQISAATMIRQVAMKSIGNRDRSQQEICHLILQEPLYRCDFPRISVHLETYSHRQLGPTTEGSTNRAFRDNIFDKYGKRFEEYPEDVVSETLEQMSFCQFVRNWKLNPVNGALVRLQLNPIISWYPDISSDPTSPKYFLYCKYFLMKHKPWKGSPSDAWDLPIMHGPLHDGVQNHDVISDDNDPSVRERYVSAFTRFSSEVDVSRLEMYNADVERLRRIREECIEENVYNGNEELDNDSVQEQWMRFTEIRSNNLHNDAYLEIEYLPRMDPAVNWLTDRLTPPDKVNSSREWLQQVKNNNTGLRRIAPLMHQNTLRGEQRFAFDIWHWHNANEQQLLLLVMGGPGTGKSAFIHAVATACLNEDGTSSALLMGTTGTAAYGIAGYTAHSALHLPLNAPLKPLKGEAKRTLQDRLRHTRVVILDEISMLGSKGIKNVDARLREASGKLDRIFGGFHVILVGDFKQLPPVGDKPIYSTTEAGASSLFQSFQTVVLLKQSQRHQGDSEDHISFRRVLTHCEQGTLDETDWDTLKRRTPAQAADASNIQWDNAPRLFFDNKKVSRYNIDKLIGLRKPVAEIKARHNEAAAAKRDSNEAQGVLSVLYLAVGADVMLVKTIWQEVGLHNGAKGKVIDIVYDSSNGPRSDCLPNCVVVVFPDLDEAIPSFLDDVPKSVAIPVVTTEWPKGTSSGYFSRSQIPLVLSWASTIHKAQGKTLDSAVIDLGASEKCQGLALVALSRVRRLNDFLILPLS